MGESSEDVLKRYIQDAIAAEATTEDQLNGLADQEQDGAVKAVLQQYALKTRSHYQRLASYLERLGGKPSTTKSLLAHIFGVNPKTTRSGHGTKDGSVRNLMMAFAIKSNELAMYEALASIAEASGDPDAVSLARTIQKEDEVDAQAVWQLLPDAALKAQRQAEPLP